MQTSNPLSTLPLRTFDLCNTAISAADAHGTAWPAGAINRLLSLLSQTQIRKLSLTVGQELGSAVIVPPMPSVVSLLLAGNTQYTNEVCIFPGLAFLSHIDVHSTSTTRWRCSPSSTPFLRWNL